MSYHLICAAEAVISVGVINTFAEQLCEVFLFAQVFPIAEHIHRGYFLIRVHNSHEDNVRCFRHIICVICIVNSDVS